VSTTYEARPATLSQLVSAKFVAGLNRARSLFSRVYLKFKNNPTAGSFLRRAGLFAVFFYLMYQLSLIGWSEIFSALPTSPLFYLLSLAFVLTPVIAELVSFQKLSGLKVVKQGKLFVRKHVINEAIMSYAGEAYLVQRLAKLGVLEFKQAAIIIKDMALIRTFVANFWLLIIVLATIFMGNSSVLKTLATASSALVITVGTLSISACLGVVLLFSKLTRLDFSETSKIAAIYLSRSIVVAVILITQWSIAIPGKAFTEWFVFLVVLSISKKSPIGGDLLFASVVITLPSLGGNSPEIAAMLIAIAAVTQLIYFLSFVLTSDFNFFNRQKQITA